MPLLNTMIGCSILNPNGMKRHTGENLAPSHALTNNQALSATDILLQQLVQQVAAMAAQQEQAHVTAPVTAIRPPHKPHAASTAPPPPVPVPLPAPEHGGNRTSTVTDVVSTSTTTHSGAPSSTFLQIKTGPPKTTLLAAIPNGTIFG